MRLIKGGKDGKSIGELQKYLSQYTGTELSICSHLEIEMSEQIREVM